MCQTQGFTLHTDIDFFDHAQIFFSLAEDILFRDLELKTYQHVLDSQRREAQEAMPDILRLESCPLRQQPPGLQRAA